MTHMLHRVREWRAGAAIVTVVGRAVAFWPGVRRAALGWAGAFLLLIVLAGCAAQGAAPSSGQEAVAQALPMAPPFTLPRLDGAGDLSLADFQGQVVVLNVWASWCPPCRAEAPTFAAVARAVADRGVTVLGLNIQDTPDAARQFVRDYALPYPNVRDEAGSVALAYGAIALPTTIFIDRQGRIARRWVGVLSEQQLVAFIEEIA